MKENVESIVAEMRRREKSHYYPKVARNIMHQYADRLGVAWRREREELDKRISDLEAYAKLWTGRADELRLKCDEFYAKAKPVGNSAAMREALKTIHDRVNSLDEECGVDPVEIRDLARAAISAPARNCDVGTAEEQKERFDAFCDAQPRKRYCCDCILQKNRQGLCEGLCEFAWAQMPYDEEEGCAK